VRLLRPEVLVVGELVQRLAELENGGPVRARRLQPLSGHGAQILHGPVETFPLKG
jgi:hypothetical protein